MSRNLAIVGGGVMGETILSGFLSAGVDASTICVAERHEERRQQLEDLYGVTTFSSNTEAAAWADDVWVIVKPQDALALLDEIAPCLDERNLVVSLCAGLTTELLGRHLPGGMPVVRVMPNTPARIGQGTSAVSAGAHATDEQLQRVRRAMGSVGKVVVVPEDQQDAVTATSGSGPAYLFAVAEAMTAAAIELGLDAKVADTLVRNTLLGSAALLAESPHDAAELRRQVTSAKGTTAAALDVLTEAGMADAFARAMQAAARRSAELAREAGA